MENEELVPAVEEIDELPEVQEGEEDTTDWKAVALKNQGIAKRLKTRLEKVKIVPDKPEVKLEVKPEEPKPQGLSTKDMMALINAKVSEEDIGEVEEYAQFKKISVAEALKSSIVRSFLAEKVEQRKMAEATNIKGTSKKSTKTTDILQKVSEGIMPESEDDIREMARARREQQLNKNKTR